MTTLSQWSILGWMSLFMNSPIHSFHIVPTTTTLPPSPATSSSSCKSWKTTTVTLQPQTRCVAWAATKKSSSSSTAIQLFPNVSIVSVCTAELCRCQDDEKEGSSSSSSMGGDEILANLKARNLPYVIDEAPCLGACGGGAMVAIDFDDGTWVLVAGIDETLSELGLTSSSSSASASSSQLQSSFQPKKTTTTMTTTTTTKMDQSETLTAMELDMSDNFIPSTTAILNDTLAKQQAQYDKVSVRPSMTTQNKNAGSTALGVDLLETTAVKTTDSAAPSTTSTTKKPIVDARDRMRAQAKQQQEEQQQEQRGNP